MGKSLLDVLRDVTLDAGEQAAFAADPSGYLAQYGYQDVQADDLSEAFSLVADTLPPEVAQAVSAAEVGLGGPDTAPVDNGSSFGEGFDAAPPAPTLEVGAETVSTETDLASETSQARVEVDEVDDDMGFGAGDDRSFDEATGDGFGLAPAGDDDGTGPDFGDETSGIGDEASGPGVDAFDLAQSADELGSVEDLDDGFGDAGGYDADDSFDDADAAGGLGDVDDIGSF